MIKFAIDGLEDVIRDIDKLQVTLEDRIRGALEAIMSEGYVIASVRFDEALYAGTNDVEVDPPRWDGDTLILEAHGNAVAFIEFGTGTNYFDYPDPSVYEKLDMSPHGTYGEGYGANVRWWYKGDPGNAGRPKRHRDGTYDEVWSTSWGNPPARAMYEAGKVLDKDRIQQILKEKFS